MNEKNNPRDELLEKLAPVFREYGLSKSICPLSGALVYSNHMLLLTFCHENQYDGCGAVKAAGEPRDLVLRIEPAPGLDPSFETSTYRFPLLRTQVDKIALQIVDTILEVKSTCWANGRHVHGDVAAVMPDESDTITMDQFIARLRTDLHNCPMITIARAGYPLLTDLLDQFERLRDWEAKKKEQYRSAGKAGGSKRSERKTRAASKNAFAGQVALRRKRMTQQAENNDQMSSEPRHGDKMTTKQAMNTAGQHQTSLRIQKMILQGKQITNLWTNGGTGDQAFSIVEIDSHAAYIVDNGGCCRLRTGFAAAVAEVTSDTI